MGRRRRSVGALLIVLAATVAAVGVATAAPSAPRDPLKLVPQGSDVPGAKIVETGRGPEAIEKGLGKMGIPARAAHYAYVDVRTGGRRLDFAGVVIATGSAMHARKAFAFLKRESVRRAQVVRLTRFGDEQLATYTTDAGGDLLVRRNTVIWALSVRATGAGELSWEQSRPALAAVAAKQQRRVGRG